MASILDLAKSVIASPPPGAPGTYYYGGTSWCQTFVGDSLTKAGVRYSNSYPSANAARRASTIVSKDPRKAPPGAIHYWVENHVAIATGPGRVRHIAATGRAAGNTLSLGKSVFEHDTPSYPLTYAGWSYGNGNRPPITGFTDPYAVALKPNQRLTNVETRLRFEPARVGNNYDPNANLPSGTVITPQGWKNGEVIDGSAVWLKVGERQWAHVSCLTDRGTHDLNDLNSYAGKRVVRGDIPNGRVRADATTASDQLGILTPNQQVAVTRYKLGENVTSDGVTTAIWFEALNGFAWAGSFTDPSTSDLTEIKDPPSEVDYTRKVSGTQGVNVRQYPSEASQIVGSIPLHTEITISQYTRGDAITQNNHTDLDIWYLVEGGVSWAGAFDSQSTEGLTFVDLQMPDQQYPSTPYSFITDFPGVVDRVVAADLSNFENEYSVPDVALRKGFPLKPAALVRHQWGKPGDYSLESVLNTFQARHLNDGDKVSPHFTIGINTLTGAVEIIQNVQLGVRAYHAGAGGNDYIGIEIDPRISLDNALALELIKAVRRLEAAIADKYGDRLPAKYHQDLPGANTACGVYIKPVAKQLDAPFEGDSDTPPVDDRSAQAIIDALTAEIKASEARVIKAMPKSGTIEF